MSEISAYKARVKNVDPVSFLGRLVWFGVPGDLRVPHAEFKKILADNGVGDTPPPEPKAHDTFRRVAQTAKRAKVPTNNPDVWESYRSVEFQDEDTIVKRIVRDRVDNSGHKITTNNALFEIVFDRATETLEVEPLNGFVFRPGGEAADIRDRVVALYDREKDALYDQPIREWIRSSIYRRHATMVKRGLYFLREDHIPALDALEAVAETLSKEHLKDGVVQIHQMPLIDDRKQREMVQKAFEAETIDAVDSLLEEVIAIRRDGKTISQDRYVAFMDKYQELYAKTADYQELLEDKLTSTEHRLDLFSQSLLSLRKNVKVKDSK